MHDQYSTVKCDRAILRSAKMLLGHVHHLPTGRFYDEQRDEMRGESMPSRLLSWCCRVSERMAGTLNVASM